MDAQTLLHAIGLDPHEPVLLIPAGEAVKNLLDAAQTHCPGLRMGELTTREVRGLLAAYAECVVAYHPEAYHQERATFLRNFEMLKAHGLTAEDYCSLDFA